MELVRITRIEKFEAWRFVAKIKFNFLWVRLR